MSDPATSARSKQGPAQRSDYPQAVVLVAVVLAALSVALSTVAVVGLIEARQRIDELEATVRQEDQPDTVGSDIGSLETRAQQAFEDVDRRLNNLEACVNELYGRFVVVTCPAEVTGLP